MVSDATQPFAAHLTTTLHVPLAFALTVGVVKVGPDGEVHKYVYEVHVKGFTGVLTVLKVPDVFTISVVKLHPKDDVSEQPSCELLVPQTTVAIYVPLPALGTIVAPVAVKPPGPVHVIVGLAHPVKLAVISPVDSVILKFIGSQDNVMLSVSVQFGDESQVTVTT